VLAGVPVELPPSNPESTGVTIEVKTIPGVNESNYQKDLNLSIPITKSGSLELGVTTDQDGDNRKWKAGWKIKF